MDALVFLIRSIFDIYLFILSARLILVWERASLFNPLSQFVVRVTAPIIDRLKKVVPSINRFESATWVSILILELLKIVLVASLYGDRLSWFVLLVLAVAGTIRIILNTFFFAILVLAILSWLQPAPSPVSQFLSTLSAPIMRPLRRVVPPIAGLDITPIPALIILQVLIILL